MQRIFWILAILVMTANPVAARELKAYEGDPVPPALRLPDLHGKTVSLSDLRGRVVLVNFWATWCPPCVKEMPSMQRLQEKFAKRPFSILAVNMGETEDDVQAFLKRVPVDFTIIMDRDGATLKAWKVFAFPTSFIVDRDGKIRLAVFGEVDWEAPEVVAKIEKLFPAAKTGQQR